jgi:hypothetical protein
MVAITNVVAVGRSFGDKALKRDFLKMNFQNTVGSLFLQILKKGLKKTPSGEGQPPKVMWS